MDLINAVPYEKHSQSANYLCFSLHSEFNSKLLLSSRMKVNQSESETVTAIADTTSKATQHNENPLHNKKYQKKSKVFSSTVASFVVGSMLVFTKLLKVS